jgi:hypothetical protein
MGNDDKAEDKVKFIQKQNEKRRHFSYTGLLGFELRISTGILKD